MSIRHAILGLLAEGPLHGYALKAAYEEGLVPGAALNIGQVYPALDKLEADGLATVSVVAQPERPDRRVYTITDAGRRELQAWLATPSRQEADLRNEAYLKIALAVRGGDPLAVIAAERRESVRRLRERAAARDEESSLAGRMLQELAVLREEAFHRWLEACEEMIRREGGGR